MAAKKTAKKAKGKRSVATSSTQGITPKSKPPKQDPALRGKLDRRVEKLTQMVCALLKHPQSELIMAKEWMHDESIPTPSVDLIAYIAHEMLYGRNRATYFEASACVGIETAFSCFIELTNRLDAQQLTRSVEIAIGRLTLIGWWGGKQDAHWWLCRWNMDKQHSQPNHSIGARRIAQAMIDILVARSLLVGESKQIEGLARVAKEASGPRLYKGEAATEIALLVFKWYRHLEGKLERHPSRAELREFIGVAEPTAPTSNDAWNTGLRLLLFPLASPRRIRSDGIDVVKLALLARGTGPQYPMLLPRKEKPVEPGWVTRARGA